MSALNATNLLATWEQGASQHPLERAVSLLHCAWPRKTRDEWAATSIGERDRQLLRLREKLFGSKIEATAACPQCASELEIAFTARDLESSAAAEPLATEKLKLVSGDYEIDYRLPTTMDLIEVVNATGKPSEVLLERCVDVRQHGEPVQTVALPAPLIELIETSMTKADPFLEIEIALDCAGCSHRWSMVFDVVSYLWGEIEDWAGRLIRDVHSLAAAYGWSEREIVEMGARRRQMYLELVHV